MAADDRLERGDIAVLGSFNQDPVIGLAAHITAGSASKTDRAQRELLCER